MEVYGNGNANEWGKQRVIKFWILRSRITYHVCIASITFKLASALYVLECKICFGIRQFSQYKLQRRASQTPIVLFDRQKNHQPMNRSYDAYICSSYQSPIPHAPRACDCYSDFVLLTETYMTVQCTRL